MTLSDKYRNTAEDWALVTGASGGTGLAITEKLAALGYNLALTDIDGEALHRVAINMHDRYGVRAHTMELDLSRRESPGRLHDWCRSEEIEPLIVVNNAGVFRYNDLAATDTDTIELFTGLHVTAVSLICHLFIPSMIRRGRGYILNMSSYSSWMPWAGLALYSATKSYIRNFSLSLAAELREKGIHVSVVMPAGVTTGPCELNDKWQKTGRRWGILLTPEKVADLALGAMFRSRRHLIPGLFLRLVLPLVRSLPGWALRLARRKTLRFQK